MKPVRAVDLHMSFSEWEQKTRHRQSQVRGQVRLLTTAGGPGRGIYSPRANPLHKRVTCMWKKLPCLSPV